MRAAITLPTDQLREMQDARDVMNAEATLEEAIHLILERSDTPDEVADVIDNLQQVKDRAAFYLDRHRAGMTVVVTGDHHKGNLDRFGRLLDGEA